MKTNNEYKQIEVVLHNAKLEANSAMKREQRFLVFSKAEAEEQKRLLMGSPSFGSDSFITFES